LFGLGKINKCEVGTMKGNNKRCIIE